MSVHLIAEKKIQVGKPTTVEGPSPTPPFAVVFEDDGDTGYFYALDKSRSDSLIVDAMHIYDTKAVSDRHRPSTVQIVWSLDHQKAALLINSYPHAIFDFAARRGYCRTGFPSVRSHVGWTQHSHDWDEKALELFR